MKTTQNDTQKVLLCVFWVKVIQNDAQKSIFECILSESNTKWHSKTGFWVYFDWKMCYRRYNWSVSVHFWVTHNEFVCKNGETDQRIWNKWAPLSITDHLLHLYHNKSERNYLKTTNLYAHMQYNITIHTNFAGISLECAFQWRGGILPCILPTSKVAWKMLRPWQG